jgi:hypothetical protein
MYKIEIKETSMKTKNVTKHIVTVILLLLSVGSFIFGWDKSIQVPLVIATALSAIVSYGEFLMLFENDPPTGKPRH